MRLNTERHANTIALSVILIAVGSQSRRSAHDGIRQREIADELIPGVVDDDADATCPKQRLGRVQ